MLKIGITGGIGSGKTTVCEVFKAIGVETYNSDARAKKLMETKLTTPIKELLGNESINENGTLNKHFITQKVFSNQSLNLLKQLNQIVHPAVIIDFELWAKQQQCKYVLLESAILFEHNLNELMDITIIVTADTQIRIERVQKRDGITLEEVLNRMSFQYPQEYLIPQADYIIDTSILITPQVIKINEILAQLK